MDLGLTGRTAFVTGGNGGIGQEVARAFAAEGARVAIGYRADRGSAERLAAELGAERDAARAVRYALDEPGSAADAVAEVERWHGLDILVTAAVTRSPRRGPGSTIEDVDPAVWEPVLQDNLIATVHTVQAAVPGMRRRGWGRIALLSSHVVRDGHRGQEFYGAAKAGLHGFARSLAWDVSPDGVLVNVICPGLTLTGKVRDGMPAAVREAERACTPTGQLSEPRDVAHVVVFLCSAANRNVTGESLTVAGGR
jgi:3-oxoacyl-[acyl-carrier protein] reductase